MGTKTEETVQDFPIDSLPDDIKNFVQEISTEYQTPPEMVFQACLTAISYSTRNVWSIRTAQRYVEPLQLWTMTLAEPGERKGVMSKAFEPIRHAEVKAMEKYFDDVDFYKTITLPRIKQITKSIEKIFSDDSLSEEEKLRLSKNLREKMRDLQEPIKPTYVATDTTVEGLAKELQRNHESIAIADTEATILKTLGGIYNSKGQTNLGFINKTYMCEHHAVSRSTGDTVLLNLPFTAIGLFIQPETVDKLWNTDFIGTGFFQRFLFSVPKTKIGYRNTDPPAAEDATIERWNKKLTYLLDSSLAIREASTFTSMSDLNQLNFSDEAYQRYREFVAEFEVRFRPESGDLTGTLAGWASKLPGTLARIAANLALFDDQRETVSLKYLECALTLAEYYITHAKRVFGVMSGTTTVGRQNDMQQEQIIKWIIEHAPRIDDTIKPFTVREIAQVVRHWKGPFKIPYARCRELVETTIEGLVSESNNRWITSIEQGKGPGRPTCKYSVDLNLYNESMQGEDE